MNSDSQHKLVPFFENAKVFSAICLSLFHFLQHTDHSGNLIDNPSDWLKFLIQLLFATVFIFFIISGYVIPAHMSKTSYRIQNLGVFLSKRFIRIYIPFLACVVGYLALDFLFKWYNHLPFVFELKRFLANISFTATFTKCTFYNPIFWTLAIEIQFYIFIALVYPLLDRIKSQFSFITLGFLIAISGWFLTDHRLLFEYLPMIFSGYFLFMHSENKIDFKVAVFIILLQLIAIAFIFNLLISIVLGLFFVLYFMNFKKILFPSLAIKTYSFYLFHGLFGGTFLYFSARHVESTFSIILVLILAVIFSILGSWVTFYLFEKPALRLSKKNFKSK